MNKAKLIAYPASAIKGKAEVDINLREIDRAADLDHESIDVPRRLRTLERLGLIDWEIKSLKKGDLVANLHGFFRVESSGPKRTRLVLLERQIDRNLLHKNVQLSSMLEIAATGRTDRYETKEILGRDAIKVPEIKLRRVFSIVEDIRRSKNLGQFVYLNHKSEETDWDETKHKIKLAIVDKKTEDIQAGWFIKGLKQLDHYRPHWVKVADMNDLFPKGRMNT